MTQPKDKQQEEVPEYVRGVCPNLSCTFQGRIPIAKDTPIQLLGEILQVAGRYLSRSLDKQHQKGKHND